MACVAGILGRSVKLPSNYVASLCVAKLIDRLPPKQRLLPQPIQELEVHSGPRTHMPGFNGYLAEFFGCDPLQEIVHEFRTVHIVSACNLIDMSLMLIMRLAHLAQQPLSCVG